MNDLGEPRRESALKPAHSKAPASRRTAGLALCLLLFCSGVLGQNVPTKDKASLVTLFLKSTKWPPETFSGPQAPIVLGILGQNPLGTYAEGFSIDPKLAQACGRRIEVKTFNTVEEVRDCHLLFVSSSEDNNLTRIERALENSNVLTMGETEEFIRHGGLIKVMGLIQGQKHFFELNTKVYERSRLKINPQLLAYGKAIAKI